MADISQIKLPDNNTYNIQAYSLAESEHVSDKTPYLRRTVPSIGNKCVEKLVGVSYVFNQLVPNGNFTSTTGWTSQNATVNSASNNELDVSYLGNGEYNQNIFCGFGFTPDVSHVYFTTIDIKLPTTSGEIGLLGGSQVSLVSTTATTDWQTLSAVFKGNTYSYFIVRNRTANVELNNVKLRNAMFIDLTAMFGLEVADYIYSLESGTIGSGVAKFRELFVANYYPYTGNMLMSSKIGAKNIYDGNNTLIETYNFSGSRLVHRRFGYRDYQEGDESLADTITDGTVTVTKLETPFDETVSNPELRGIIKLDANNNLYCDGDTCDDFTNPQIVISGGVEEFVDSRNIALPSGHDTNYYWYNDKEKLNSLPNSAVSDGSYAIQQTAGQMSLVSTALTDFTSEVTWGENKGGSTKFCYRDGIIYLQYQGEAKAHAVDDLLFTLPSAYRPKTLTETIFPFVKNSHAYGNLKITKSDGKCIVNAISNTTNTGRIYFNVTLVL